MLWSVSRRGDRPQGEIADLDLVAVADRVMRMGESAVPWGDQRRPESYQFPGPGDEIGVEVGLCDVADLQATRYGLGSRSGSITRAEPSPRSTT
jgi:hypothetical protein